MKKIIFLCSVVTAVFIISCSSSVSETGNNSKQQLQPKKVVLSELSTNEDLMKKGIWLDPRTGLMWYRCLLGQTYKNGTCNDDSYRTRRGYWYTLKEVTKFKFGGYTDWRAPTIFELANIRNSCNNYGGRYKITISDGNVLEAPRCKTDLPYQYTVKDQLLLDEKIFPIPKSRGQILSTSFIGGIQKLTKQPDPYELDVLGMQNLHGMIYGEQSVRDFEALLVRGGDNSEYLDVVNELDSKLTYLEEGRKAWIARHRANKSRAKTRKSRTYEYVCTWTCVGLYGSKSRSGSVTVSVSGDQLANYEAEKHISSEFCEGTSDPNTGRSTGGFPEVKCELQ